MPPATSAARPVSVWINMYARTKFSSSRREAIVTKRYEEGETVAGQLVTYLLTYHNACPAQYWWWGLQGNAILTDILPDGLEFVSAERWQCGADTWCDAPPDSTDGQTVTWNLGRRLLWQKDGPCTLRLTRAHTRRRA